jgi:hypothetical protein
MIGIHVNSFFSSVAFDGAPEEVDITVCKSGTPEAEAISQAAAQLVAKVQEEYRPYQTSFEGICVLSGLGRLY